LGPSTMTKTLGGKPGHTPGCPIQEKNHNPSYFCDSSLLLPAELFYFPFSQTRTFS
jgi:hypothetical protein